MANPVFFEALQEQTNARPRERPNHSGVPTAAGGSATPGHWEAAKGAMKSRAYKQPSCAIAQDSLAEG